MKKVTSILLVLTMLLVLVACGASDTATETNEASTDSAGAGEQATDEVIKIRVGWSPPDITGVFKTATDYMEKAIADAAEHGIEIELVTRSSATHTDAADQIKTLENFIQNKVDVIVVSPTEVEAVKPALKKINEAEIPLILVNMLDEMEGIHVDNFVGFDNAQAAAVSAYSMLDALGGPGVLGEGEKWDVPIETSMDLEWWEEQYKDVPTDSITGNIAIIEGIAGDFFSSERNRGFSEVIEKFPGVTIKTILPANWNRQDAVEAAENIIQNNPDLDGIFASCAEMALGAYIAANNAGVAEDLIIISNDGTPESVQAIRDGQLDAETWHGFPEWGWYAMKFSTMLALDQEVPQKFDIRPRTEYLENADNFYPEPKLEAIDWEAIKSAVK
jgi:ABC-type sugar transport system, periplasmic component